MRWVWRGVALAGLLAVAALLAMVVYGWRALPLTEGTLRLDGAPAGLRIERDEHGIPTIHAATLRDAMYGLGVVHAQDRLWQLETHRRIGSGRLAEAFGKGALDSDRFLRALGVRHAAAAQWAQVPAEQRSVAEAYAQGINATVQGAGQARPPEFLVLGLRPEAWTPVDSLAWAIMMAWDLGGNWNNELLRLRLALKFPMEEVHALVPPYPGETPRPTADFSALFRGLGLDGRTVQSWTQLPEAGPPSGIEGTGSNNWVLAGGRTATGQPLLANDPHLKLSTPALWYFVRIVTPDLQLAGASMPGVPGIVLGQNQHIAWGFTNTGPDVQDLYIEQVDPQDPKRYRTPDGWATFESRTEVIQVKGGEPVTVTTRRTRHGPVISDAGTGDDVLGAPAQARYVLALRWTALDADIDALSAQSALQSARSVDEFVAASRRWLVPMQSMVVADRAGRIGMVAAGRVPLRGPEHDLGGLVPALGWEARYDWAGWVPLDETPRETDPQRGWIATANQRIFGPEFPHFLGADWSLPYRQQRIEQVLESREKHTMDDLAALQGDITSLAAPRLLPVLRAARSDHRLAPAAIELLAGFQGRMEADSAAPALYWAWLRHLGQAVLADDLGEGLARRTGGRSWFDTLDGIFERNDTRWCDDRGTPQTVETCAQMSDRALGLALTELEDRLGTNIGQWRWGDLHELRAEHRPFSRVPALARWFELRAPLGGDTYTVNAARVVLRADGEGDRYVNDHGPSLRALYDLEDPKRSRFIHSSGQSGLVFSPHYADLLRPWTEVRYLPLWPQKAPRDVLQLQAR